MKKGRHRRFEEARALKQTRTECDDVLEGTDQEPCAECGAEVEMLTLDSAVKVSGINGHRIVLRIANNEIHSIETANGHLLLCRKSLIETLTDRTRFQD